MNNKKVVGVIPARYASTRLPGKPLVDIAGKTMIRRVYEQTMQARLLSEVVVATDDERIYQEIASLGGKALMTSPDHPQSTDRVAEAARGFPEAEVIVEIQGDQPLVVPETIDLVAEVMLADSEILITNLIAEISRKEAEEPSIVKAVRDNSGFALYFSRSLIPFPKEERCHYYKVADVYGYRPALLKKLLSLAPTPLEEAEAVGQLRILEHGYRIKLVITSHNVPAVNTPEDLEKVRRMIGHNE